MSYFIKAGSLNNFAVRPAAAAEVKSVVTRDLLEKNESVLSGIKNLSELEFMQRALAKEEIPFVPEALPVKGGIGLQGITLYKNFEGLMNLFNPLNEIYFVAWSWDLSGNEPYVYPGKDIDPGKWFSPVRKGDTVQFIGSGINLFPKQEIKGGVGVHIEVWESDKDVRKAGETIVKITEAIQKSELKEVLTTLASANVYSGTIVAISEAVLALSKIIGGILKDNSDDYVNLFEGYYDVESWTKGAEVYKNPVKDPICEIILNKY